MIRFLLFMLPLVGPGLGQDTGAKAISVCVAVNHATKYRGQVVTIEGRWAAGGEVSVLLPYKCSFDTKERRWPDALWMMSRPSGMEKRVGSWMNRDSLERYKVELRYRDSGSVLVLVRGRLEITEQFEELSGADGRLLPPRGYGHLGKFQGQLVLQEVVSAKVSFRDW